MFIMATRNALHKGFSKTVTAQYLDLVLLENLCPLCPHPIG